MYILVCQRLKLGDGIKSGFLFLLFVLSMMILHNCSKREKCILKLRNLEVFIVAFPGTDDI